MSYLKCPACNEKKKEATKVVGVFRCKGCGAIYGDCYLGQSYEFVTPVMQNREPPADQIRYFDFTCVGSEGVSRRHGWYDTESRNIVQVG